MANRLVISGASAAFIIAPSTGSVLGGWTAEGTSVSALLSPNGESVAFWEAEAAGFQNAQLFETVSGEPLGAPLIFGAIESVTFSPDGSRLLWLGTHAEGGQYQAILQNTADGEWLPPDGLELLGDEEPLKGFFGPLSRCLVVAPADGALSRWLVLVNCLDGSILRGSLSLVQVSRIRFHPFGDTLLIAGAAAQGDQKIFLFDADAWPDWPIQQWDPLEFQYAGYDPSGRRMALVGKWAAPDLQREELRLLNGLTGAQIKLVQAADWADPVFSQNGKYMACHTLGLYIGKPITQATIWKTTTGDKIAENPFGVILAEGFSPNSTRYYYLAQLFGEATRVLRVVDLAGGNSVRDDINFEDVIGPVLTLDGQALIYLGKRVGDSLYRLERFRLSDGVVTRGSALNYASGGTFAPSGEGKRALFTYTSLAGPRRSALIDVWTVTVHQNFMASGGARFDSTVRPSFLSFDFNGDGHVDFLDLFELQRRLDPDYCEVLYDFTRASDWR